MNFIEEHPFNAAMCDIGDHHHELFFAEPGNCEISFNPAAVIAPLGVDHAANCTDNFVCAEAIQNYCSAWPLNEEFRHQGHVHHADVLANGFVFTSYPGCPMTTVPGPGYFRIFAGR